MLSSKYLQSLQMNKIKQTVYDETSFSKNLAFYKHNYNSCEKLTKIK